MHGCSTAAKRSENGYNFGPLKARLFLQNKASCVQKKALCDDSVLIYATGCGQVKSSLSSWRNVTLAVMIDAPGLTSLPSHHTQRLKERANGPAPFTLLSQQMQAAPLWQPD